MNLHFESVWYGLGPLYNSLKVNMCDRKDFQLFCVLVLLFYLVVVFSIGSGLFFVLVQSYQCDVQYLSHLLFHNILCTIVGFLQSMLLCMLWRVMKSLCWILELVWQFQIWICFLWHKRLCSLDCYIFSQRRLLISWWIGLWGSVLCQCGGAYLRSGEFFDIRIGWML